MGLQPRIVTLVSEAFSAQQAQAAALAEQQRLEQIRIQKERQEQVRLEKLRIEQQRQEQIRLEQLRIEQQRHEQIRLEKLRLEEQRRQQQLLLQQQSLSSSSSSSSSLSTLFGTGHEVKVEVPGTFLEEYNIGKK